MARRKPSVLTRPGLVDHVTAMLTNGPGGHDRLDPEHMARRLAWAMHPRYVAQHPLPLRKGTTIMPPLTQRPVNVRGLDEAAPVRLPEQPAGITSIHRMNDGRVRRYVLTSGDVISVVSIRPTTVMFVPADEREIVLLDRTTAARALLDAWRATSSFGSQRGPASPLAPRRRATQTRQMI